MHNKELHIRFQASKDAHDLSPEDHQLLLKSIEATGLAYAPYSRFRVGAAALLSSGQIVLGANQENASFPAGICAERVLLSAIASQYPGQTVQAMAISYRFQDNPGDHPIAPCGICRQTIVEFEERTNTPIRLILGSEQGEVWIFERAGELLPFHFSSNELGE